MPSRSTKYGPQPLNLTPLTAGSAQFSGAVSLPALSQYQHVNFLCTFTVGSLTNVVLTPQITFDGSTWFDQTAFASAALTANATVSLPCIASGAKQVRLKYLATGTATSSALVVDVVTQSA